MHHACNSETRMLSCLRLLCPHLDGPLRTIATALDPEGAIDRFPGRQLSAPDWGTLGMARMVAMATLLFTLGPGYSDDKRRLPQCQKRAVSASQDAGTEWDNQYDLNQFVTSVESDDYTRTPVMDHALGLLLAINKEGKYDVKVKNPDVAELSFYMNQPGSSDWGVALVNQMKMVYEGSHIKSLNFGIT